MCNVEQISCSHSFSFPHSRVDKKKSFPALKWNLQEPCKCYKILASFPSSFWRNMLPLTPCIELTHREHKDNPHRTTGCSAGVGGDPEVATGQRPASGCWWEVVSNCLCITWSLFPFPLLNHPYSLWASLAFALLILSPIPPGGVTGWGLTCQPGATQ